MKRFRLPLVRGLLCAAVMFAVTGHVALAQTGGSARSTTQEVTTQEIRISTYNVQHDLDASEAIRDVQELATRSDIVALQEMSSGTRRSGVRESLLDCTMCPFEGYMPSDAVPGGTPILYRWDRFRFEGSGTTQVSEATFVGAAGAGPATLRAKYINWVKLRERATGQSLYVLNNHAVPTVQGHGGGPNRRFPARLALYRQHMTGLATLVTELRADGSLVFITGDFNVNYRRDAVVQSAMFPYSRLAKVGVQASYQALGEPALGTHVLSSGHSLRLIDYVWFAQDTHVTPVSQQVLTGYHSDHRPVVVSFHLGSG